MPKKEKGICKTEGCDEPMGRNKRGLCPKCNKAAYMKEFWKTHPSRGERRSPKTGTGPRKSPDRKGLPESVRNLLLEIPLDDLLQIVKAAEKYDSARREFEEEVAATLGRKPA